MTADDLGTVSFSLFAGIRDAAWLRVLDDLPDAVIFLKDAGGRYVFANKTLSQRLGLSAPGDLIGARAEDVFPAPFGRRYAEQDRAVLGGREFGGQLELHLYPNRQPGWCLTGKRLVRDKSGQAVGVAGVSRDLRLRADAAPRLAAALRLLESRFAEPLRLADLAREAGMSANTFERHARRVFGLTPAQLLTRARIEAALRLLEDTDWPVARVGVECGYFDHSAFSRAFRAAVGVSPRTYRAARRGLRNASPTPQKR